MNKYQIFFAATLFFFCAFSITTNAQKRDGQTRWELHTSASGVFETKFPQKYRYNVFPFQYNPDSIAFSSEIVSSLGSNEGGQEKSILIKTVQTLGDELSEEQVKRIIEREVQKYLYAAESMNGRVVLNEAVKIDGFLGQRLYISYTEKDTRIGLRVLLLLTNYAKVEMVLTGPANTMYSYRSDEFFNSIRLFDGITKQENPLGVGWIDYVSNNNTFTAKLPPKNSNYTPKLPKIESSKHQDRLLFTINDPVLNETMYYTLSGYKFNSKASSDHVLKILFSKHISRYIPNAQSNDTIIQEYEMEDGTQVMRARIVFTPKKNIPSIKNASFELVYKGDTLLVKELAHSPHFSKSKIDQTLFSLVDFHPEKYKYIPPNKEEPAKSPPEEQKKN